MFKTDPNTGKPFWLTVGQVETIRRMAGLPPLSKEVHDELEAFDRDPLSYDKG